MWSITDQYTALDCIRALSLFLNVYLKESYRERKDREILYPLTHTSTLLIWPEWPGLGQAEARSQALPLGLLHGVEAQALGPSFATLPDALAGS